MKKILSIFFAIMMAVSSHGLFAATDGEPDIPIMPIYCPDTPIPNRNPVPISAYYDSFTSSVVISFNRNIGDVVTTIENLFTGESYNDTINAYGSLVFMPISGSEGVYTILFELSDGSEYQGEFELS